MSSLIQIHQDYLDLINAIEDNDGEITPFIESKLTVNLVESQEKVSNYCLVLDSYENQIAFMKSKVKEAVLYIDRLEKQKKKLEEIAMSVVNAKEQKLEGVGGRWINKRKTKALEIFDEHLVPSIYIKITTSIDGTAIKNDIIKNGIAVEGCKIRENESLQWK